MDTTALHVLLVVFFATFDPLGISVPALQKFCEEMSVAFSMPPTKQDFGALLAQFADSEGGNLSASAE
ncbi:MAG TPA: hypothetical protein VF018_16890 [Acidobacteriaceae bacterium]